MITDEVLLAFLESDANNALERIKQKKLLTVEEAMPLLLKAQFNHITHLDQSIQGIEARMATMATKEDLSSLKENFNSLQGNFDSLQGKFDSFQENLNSLATKDDLQQVDARFEKMEDRFEKIDRKFEKMDEKFERIYSRMNVQIAWMVGTVLAASGMIFGLEKLL